MPNIKAATVARIIVEEVARLGVPSSIHSDQGRQYESEVFSEMCRVLHIKKTRTTPTTLKVMEWLKGLTNL